MSQIRFAYYLPTAVVFTSLVGVLVLERSSVSSAPGTMLVDRARHLAQWNLAIEASGDHGWVLTRSIAIMGMQGGFALLEAGSVRPAVRHSL